ncbi:Fic family protein [Ferribacterium limneticum]|uniref:Fic family protein n=1 Tax=Ferribacterium limneticum TaxID=76259 RepID=UPI001CF86998|nr:Fic family protein [Ferribacterium limneticum]UCV23588.1 Fic family protein [Ferribacterium limneticum]
MATPRRDLQAEILKYLGQQLAGGQAACAPDAITTALGAPRSTVNYHLAQMVAEGNIQKRYGGPATRYALLAQAGAASWPAGLVSNGFQFSAGRQSLVEKLNAPIGTRKPVAYQRSFVEDYVPNQSTLIPPAMAQELFEKGRARGQQPAGTYARKVLEQLLIDLAWHSSRLEGNRKSLLDTKALFERGRSPSDDEDALMLLNHKDAIEFVVDEVPHYGILDVVVRNIQSLLMNGLLRNSDALGKARNTVVNITNSVYVPLQVPQLLDEILATVVDKGCHIKNPIEAAFFLWVNIAYLQPFEDGNKRTSRLCANLPLLLQNCAPLSFMDVEQADYALAVLAVYEQQDVSLAVELFDWTYRRSIDKYAAVLEATSAPDPFRRKYRELLGDAVRQVVASAAAVANLVPTLGIDPADQEKFAQLLRDELQHLETYNCARYRLGFALTDNWIAAGRPGL